MGLVIGRGGVAWNSARLRHQGTEELLETGLRKEGASMNMPEYASSRL